ncbi:uncharacterized protein LOC130666735 [Microplitis mediator]|uniref:uncharacterized protein LOC130666735 n=1 Tax=Microplitis mediator TaxID=375433 RepID=UPI0025549EF3|nr:uncharacterized protein LOC130666735 [Microplitis mediator]XP_057323956.1 uncharacterized protein LOC130666735 [Microplitis mediator]
MGLIRLFILIGGIVFCNCNTTFHGNDTKTKLAQGEKQLGNQIRLILKHYQQPDPIGLPGAPIPDPMMVPDMKHSFSMYTMNFKSIKVYGLSKFRIEHVQSELALMQVSVALSIETLDIRGLYTLSSWLSGSSGDFIVKLSGVNIQGLAKLQVGTDGKLHAQDIDMNLTFVNIDMDFKNLGFFGAVFQSVINSVGAFIFDSIKPFILNEVNTNVRGEVNKQISQLPQYFPNSISPFDMAVAEARKQFSNMGYDPYRVKDYSQSVGIFTITSSHTWLTGLASFYRMGNITLTMENGTVYAILDVGTQEIEGRTHWEVGVIGGFLSRAGTVSFTVQYFRVQVKLSQPVDTRKRASLEELNLELGNIQTRIRGAGTVDYIIEAGINILPNLLRYQIMDAIEGPIKRRLQDELNKLDVEKLIHEKIPEIEEKAIFFQGMTPSKDIIFEESPPLLPVDQEPFSESEEERGPS